MEVLECSPMLPCVWTLCERLQCAILAKRLQNACMTPEQVIYCGKKKNTCYKTSYNQMWLKHRITVCDLKNFLNSFHYYHLLLFFTSLSKNNTWPGSRPMSADCVIPLCQASSGGGATNKQIGEWGELVPCPASQWPLELTRRSQGEGRRPEPNPLLWSSPTAASQQGRLRSLWPTLKTVSKAHSK